jgi:hypothetical protein
VSIVEFEVFRDELGVAADSPDVDRVSKLYEAIGEEIERLTRRRFAGDEGATYTETIRIREEREFSVANVPVASIASIAPVAFDGTVGDVYAADEWRLESAARGRIRIRARTEYVQVVYAIPAGAPAAIVQAFLEWGKTRWGERDRTGGLASYSTGADSESYFATLAGRPPRGVMVALLGARHDAVAGVI